MDVQEVAPTDTNSAYSRGNRGPEKEVIARAVHTAGNRQKKPFIKVNCAAIPANLVESEFFRA